MKRFAVFILLGPVLFALCIWGLFLPVASLVTVGAVRFDIEVVSYLGVLLGLMFGGLFLALVDWLAQMLAMRPWFTGAVGWGNRRRTYRCVVRCVCVVVVRRQRTSGGHPRAGVFVAVE